MGLWSRLKRGHQDEQVPFGDAVCVVDRVVPSGNKLTNKLGSEVRHLMQLMRAPGQSSLDASNLPREQPECPSRALADLPSAPAFYIWRDLPSDSKRALR